MYQCIRCDVLFDYRLQRRETLRGAVDEERNFT